MCAKSTDENKNIHTSYSTKSQAELRTFVPVLRPHNRRRGRDVFFMISKRPLLKLLPEESELYENIDGRRTIARLEEIYPGGRDTLLRWWERGVIELIPPIEANSGPHLVVIEPHMDDAVLSAGGRLLHRRGKNRITILSVVHWSNFTSYMSLQRSFLDARHITDVRQRESTLVARLLGAEHRHLDWVDAPLRVLPEEHWSITTIRQFACAPQLFTNQFPDPRDVSRLAKLLMQNLSDLKPDELWIPMGLGDHVDHRTTRSACLRILAEAPSRFSHIPVLMYEDLPYADNVEHVKQLCSVHGSCGANLARVTEDITDVFEEKLRLISVYASQFKLSAMEPAIRKIAIREGNSRGSFAEAYHRFDRGSRQWRVPTEALLSREWKGLSILQRKVRRLLQERTKWSHMNILVLPSGFVGKWATACHCLVTAFPSAHLRVFASKEVEWQIEGSGSEKVRVEIIRGGLGRWAGIICREMLHFRTPTVIVWRGAYAGGRLRRVKKLINIFFKSLFPLRHVLFARTIFDFCNVIYEQLTMSQ